MSISIDRVYKTVLTLVNTDIRGNATPAEIRLLINDSVNEIYNEYLFEINKLTNRANRGLISSGLEDLTERIREKIQYFLVNATLTFTTPYFILPANAKFIEALFYDDATEIESCRNAKEFQLLNKSSSTKPTLKIPICLRTENKVKVLPDTILDKVTCSYLRTHLIANWTYTVVSGAEIYNPSLGGFQDIDLHNSEESNVVMKTLKKLGVNLKEEDIVQYSTTNEQIKNNEDNQI